MKTTLGKKTRLILPVFFWLASSSSAQKDSAIQHDSDLFSSAKGNHLVNQQERETAPERSAGNRARSNIPNLIPHLSLDFSLFNSFDSNVNHDEENTQSYGVVPSLHFRFLNRPADPIFTMNYIVAHHSYTNTEKWDRISNKLNFVLGPKLSRSLYSETYGEVSLKGSSEDRDLSNQVLLGQEFEYRFTRNNRLQFYGMYRYKWFDDGAGDSASKPYIGVQFERRQSNSERWEIGGRYEKNRVENPRGDYSRWKFELEYRTPVFASGNQLYLEAEFRKKLYDRRFVEIEDEDFLRRDQRWVLSATWKRAIVKKVQMEVAYQFESRDSNDPDKWFNAHLTNIIFYYGLMRPKYQSVQEKKG